MSDHLRDVRDCIEWWSTPGPNKIVSAARMQQLIDGCAWLLAGYDLAGLASDRAQIIRAKLQRWEDNPPVVGEAFSWFVTLSMVADANWLLGVVDGVMSTKPVETP